MDLTAGVLTQSKFFSPVFNAAIFDGPIKIYFSQIQEGLALQLYFEMQKMGVDTSNTKSTNLESNNLFIMLYPNSESFYNSFDKSFKSDDSSLLVVQETWGDHQVLGVRGPIDTEEVSSLNKKIKDIFTNKMPTFLGEGVEAFA